MKTYDQIKRELEYRIAERIAILAGNGPVEEWMRQMAEREADRWERRYEATSTIHTLNAPDASRESP